MAIGLLLPLALAACGSDTRFSVPHTISTFQKHGVSLEPPKPLDCPKDDEIVVSPHCWVGYIYVGKGKPHRPIAELEARGRPLRYRVLVFRTRGDVNDMAASGDLDRTRDPISRERIDSVYRGNVVASCWTCSQRALTTLRAILDDL